MDKVKTLSTALRGRSASFAVAAGLVILCLALYRIGTGKDNDLQACGELRSIAERLMPLATGEVAAVILAKPPRLPPDFTFEDSNGQTLRLADFKGRAVLLNFWATWCVPCRREMPALDRLERELGGSDFTVIAVNIDTTRFENRRRFLEEAGINRLAFYADPKAQIFQILKGAGTTIGLPTTLLIDRAGCQVASLAGPADWSSSDAIGLIQALIRS